MRQAHLAHLAYLALKAHKVLQGRKARQATKALLVPRVPRVPGGKTALQAGKVRLATAFQACLVSMALLVLQGQMAKLPQMLVGGGFMRIYSHS